jgi:hypothetical protein
MSARAFGDEREEECATGPECAAVMGVWVAPAE